MHAAISRFTSFMMVDDRSNPTLQGADRTALNVSRFISCVYISIIISQHRISVIFVTICFGRDDGAGGRGQ